MERVLRFSKRALVPAALALPVLSAIPTLHPARAATVSNIEVPADSVDPPIVCNGQALALNGTIHLLMHQTTDGAGATHLGLSLNYHDVTGVALPAGITYRVTGASSSGITSGGSGAEVHTAVDNVRLITQGSAAKGAAPNMTIRMIYHVTTDARGQVTASVQDSVSTCGT